MHVVNMCSPGAFMQIVNILRHNQQIVVGFGAPFMIEPGKRVMRRVRPLGLHRLTPRIVKPQNQIGITGKPLWRGDILDPMLFPQSSLGAKRLNPAFRADASAGQDYDILQSGLHPSNLYHIALGGKHYERSGPNPRQTRLPP